MVINLAALINIETRLLIKGIKSLASRGNQNLRIAQELIASEANRIGASSAGKIFGEFKTQVGSK